MPNIEVHGLGEEAYETAKILIDKALSAIDLADDAVTTFVSSKVHSCDGKKTDMPFLRICSTDPLDFNRIKDAFLSEEFYIDCEFLSLAKFISAEEMRAAAVVS